MCMKIRNNVSYSLLLAVWSFQKEFIAFSVVKYSFGKINYVMYALALALNQTINELKIYPSY